MPRGFGFEWVSCPHYFYECVIWISWFFATLSLYDLVLHLLPCCLVFCVVSACHVSQRLNLLSITRTLSAAFAFAAASCAVLAVRADERHAKYIAHFDGREGRDHYPSDRTRLIPLVW